MPTFSHSRIETFRRCPRQYCYRFVARVKRPEVPEQIATFFGSRCHDALEWLYDRVMKGAVPTRSQVLAEFNRVWDDNWLDDIVIREDGTTPKRYRTLGEKCVGDYYDARHPSEASTSIGLDKQVRFPLDADAGITMMGYIDRLAKDTDGTWHIHDYKTNKGLPTQADKDAEATIKHDEKTISARHGSEPENNAELERRLGESRFWDEVSSMDASRLRTLWKHPRALDPKLRKPRSTSSSRKRIRNRTSEGGGNTKRRGSRMAGIGLWKTGNDG